MTNKHILPILLLVVLLCRCMPYQEEKITEINFSLKDPLLQKVLTFQDEHQRDSLYTFLTHKDPTYRYAAAMAFASFQDKASLDKLAPLLKDEVDEVRIAAAYAIGQLKEEKAEDILVSAFESKDSTSIHENFNRSILEAVGKCASPRFLELISTTTSYKNTDTLLLEGQAWGIYRFALRGITAEEGTQRMVDFLVDDGYPKKVRFVAANYLSRASNIKLDTFTIPLVRTFQNESEKGTKMALAIALGKTRRPEALAALKDAYRNASDYRLKCNIIRTYGNFAYLDVQAEVLAALDDSNFHVSNAAAEFFIMHGIGREGAAYWRKGRDTSLNWETRLLLYKAANRHTPAYFEGTVGGINNDLRRIWVTSEKTYEKASALDALATYGWNYRYVQEKGFASDQAIVRTTAVRALANLARRSDFKTFFGLSTNRVRKDLASYFSDAIQRGDVGMMAEAADVLREPRLNFKELIPEVAFMDEALAKLKLPKEIETYDKLKKTINFFKGLPEEEESTKPELTRPIDWRVVSTVTGNTRAKIITNKGDIVLELLPELAPGSVANFVMLSRGGFYDQKYFHRVVANFVIQAGCPRGDGYGSLEYAIRSELPPVNYDEEGYVGMASAGPHTEGTQWFITHSPTPHLDGKYTIFAKVVGGMDIVHQIQMGDQISRIVIE
ncbi:MAG: peptidylprolyl isomerase [Bacteroidota bacterium]